MDDRPWLSGLPRRKSRQHVRRCSDFLLVALSILCSPVGLAWAEISIDQGTGPVQVIHIMGKIDGPDPWPDFAPVRLIPLNRMANPYGDDLGDRNPDIAVHLLAPPG